MIVDDGIRGFHPLFIVKNHAVLGLGFQLFRVFSSFPDYLIFFLSFLDIFSFLRNFGYF